MSNALLSWLPDGSVLPYQNTLVISAKDLSSFSEDQSTELPAEDPSQQQQGDASDVYMDMKVVRDGTAGSVKKWLVIALVALAVYAIFK